MSTVVRTSAFETAEEIGSALTVVRARIDGALGETRELRRELVIHRSEEAEVQVAEAVKSLQYASLELERAIRILEPEPSEERTER